MADEAWRKALKLSRAQDLYAIFATTRYSVAAAKQFEVIEILGYTVNEHDERLHL